MWQFLSVLLLVLAFLAADGRPARAQSDQDANALSAELDRLAKQGKFVEATSVAERLLALQESTLGPEHPDVARVVSSLARLRSEQGQFAEAEALYKRALAIREKALGSEHPDVATSLNTLGGLYRRLGRYPDAEELYKRGLAIREQALGPEHPDVATALINLAGLYEFRGLYAEAEPLGKRSLAIREKAFGRDHPSVAAVLNGLGGLSHRQGQYAEAEQLYKRGLAIVEKSQGLDHPDVVAHLNELGQLYRDQGRYGEAEPLYRRSLEIREKAGGPDHPGVAAAVNNLAALYRDQGNSAKAEPLFKRSLAIREKAFGRDHPTVASSLNSLAQLYVDQGRYVEAEAPSKRSLAIREKALGADHPDVANSLNNLGQLYEFQGRYPEAEAQLKRALSIAEKAYGPQHPNLAKTIGNLASVYENQGRYAEAEPLYRRAVAIIEISRGPEHADVATSLSATASLYIRQGRDVEAEVLYKRAIAIGEKAYGPDHHLLAVTLHNLAQLYRYQERYSEAEPLLLRCVAISEKTLGPDHPELAASLNELAQLYAAQSRYAEAEPLFVRGIAIAKRTLGAQHPNVAVTLANLGAVRQHEGRFAEAGELYKRSLAIIENQLGPDHPEVAWPLKHMASLALAQQDYSGAVEKLRRSAAISERRVRQGLGGMSGGALITEHVGWHFQALVKATHRLAPEGRARDEQAGAMLETAQTALVSEAARSLAQMAARSASGSTDLAALVRNRQDLAAEWAGKDKELTAARSRPPAERNASNEKALKDRLAEIEARLAELDARLAKEFPDYATLASPQPLRLGEIQVHLRDDEALLLFLNTDKIDPLPEETFLWVVTKSAVRWVRSDWGTETLKERVSRLRCGLDRDGEWLWTKESGRRLGKNAACVALRPDGLKLTELPPFDLATAHELYTKLFGEVGDVIKGKHLLIVPSGALTSLPFQVLVTAPPSGDDFANVAWLARDHALTVLPSVTSLAALRRNARTSAAPDAFIGFGDPVLTRKCGAPYIPDRCPQDAIQVAAAEENDTTRSTGSLEAVSDYFRVLDVAALKAGLCPLPDTAHELACVAKSLGAPASSVVLGESMTERAVKTMPLDRYRIVHFATHGLLAGETAQLAKINAEPSLVFSPPDTASEVDDGLLTASEVAGLKLDADWVVMSACNTASGGTPGAEALSGLARAFFYAGARALLVSHWPVDSYAATMLTSSTFAEMTKHPEIGRSEAFRRAMLALMRGGAHPRMAHPSTWAPFVVVGEGGGAAAR